MDELKLIVETAKSGGRPVVAHASTAEGMRRAILAGVETIEHGDDGTFETFQLMKKKALLYAQRWQQAMQLLNIVVGKKVLIQNLIESGKRRKF